MSAVPTSLFTVIEPPYWNQVVSEMLVVASLKSMMSTPPPPT